MAKISVGDSVRFKPGVKDYDFDVDIGGWQGRVVRFEREHATAVVAFDSITLRNMPGEYIETCEEEGLGWSEYGSDPDDLEVVPPRDTPADVETTIAELSARYAYSHLGEEGRDMNAILAGTDPADVMAVLKRWGDYLSQTLTFPFEAEVVEMLFERGPIRYGDRLRVLGIDTTIDDSHGVLVDVKRGRKSYVYPLCDLETTDDESPNHDPLQLYRVWFANR
jgi:hypothetical protein